MSTLLVMLNRMRELLRSADALAALPSGDFETDTHIALINGAAHDVLEGRDWSFDAIDDGMILFYAPATGTALDTSFGGATREVQIDRTQPDAIFLTDIQGTTVSTNGGSSGSQVGTVSRLVIETSAVIPNLSFRVVNIDTDASDTYALLIEPGYNAVADDTSFDASSTAVNWTLYSNQALLPLNIVRSVLEIRNQETPLQLEFIDQIHELRNWIPRDLWQQGPPAIAVAGGTVAGTTTASATAVVGTALTVWPVPEVRTMLQFSYMRNHAELAATGSTFAGVPDRIFDLIVWRAVQMAFSTTERNPQQAQAAGAVFSQKLQAAIEADEKMPSRVRNLTPWNRSVSAGVNTRWGAAQVPAP